MIGTIKRQSILATVALLLLLPLLAVNEAFIAPMIRDFRYGASPYVPMTNVTMIRRGSMIEGTVTLQKRAACDPTGAPPSFLRWIWQGVDGQTNLGTSVVLVNGKPLAPRKVIDVGMPATVGVITSEIPMDARAAPKLRVELIVICDPGDGRFRPYSILPQLVVPATDGTLSAASDAVDLTSPVAYRW